MFSSNNRNTCTLCSRRLLELTICFTQRGLPAAMAAAMLTSLQHAPFPGCPVGGTEASRDKLDEAWYEEIFSVQVGKRWRITRKRGSGSNSKTPYVALMEARVFNEKMAVLASMVGIPLDECQREVVKNGSNLKSLQAEHCKQSKSVADLQVEQARLQAEQRQQS